MSGIIDITGKRFANLVVTEYVRTDKRGKSVWRCKCDCGNEKEYYKWQLTSGTVKGCGCLAKKHGLCRTRIHRIWLDMKQRCYNSKNNAYSYYGGRGIVIFDEWRNSFQAFYDWAMSHGYTDELTIDRINTDGNYEPSNCRWVTRAEQQSNLRNNRILSYQNETHTFAEWARITGIPPNTIWIRAKNGWSTKDILTTKPSKRNRKNNLRSVNL